MKGFEWLVQNTPEVKEEAPKKADKPKEPLVQWTAPNRKKYKCPDCARQVTALKKTILGRRLCLKCFKKKI